MRPRDYATRETRKLFGDSEKIEWAVRQGAMGETEVLAAWVQHRVALEVNKVLRDAPHRSSIAGLADELGVSQEHLQRKFRGASKATLSEMMAWTGVLGRLDILAAAINQLAENRMPLAPAGESHRITRAGRLRPRPEPPQR